MQRSFVSETGIVNDDYFSRECKYTSLTDICQINKLETNHTVAYVNHSLISDDIARLRLFVFVFNWRRNLFTEKKIQLLPISKGDADDIFMGKWLPYL